jgi:integrase
LKPHAAKYTVRVKDCPGLFLRVTPNGAKSFISAARDPYGKQIWATIGGRELSVDDAREKARDVIRRIKDGLPAFEAPPVKPDSFGAIAENWYTRHVEAKGLRSAGELRRQLDSYILPAWKGRDFATIKKSDVARLLDGIEDGHGATQADRVLATVRGIMRWQAARDDDYVCVVTGKLRRTEPAEQRRDRILEDDEIRLVWGAATGTFGGLVRLGLLTGQRRTKIATMRWDDVTVDGHWKIPTEKREKGNGEILPLPDLALDVIRAQPRVNGNPFVFAGRGEGYFKGVGRAKSNLDAAVAKANKGKALAPWEFHDTRRTARSLLARAGVSTEIAKKVLGHADDAVQQTYNRHTYTKERGEALKALAGTLALILNPPGENVRPLKRSAGA